MDNPIYHIAKENKLIDEQYNEILHESDDELLEHNAIKINITKGELKSINLSLIVAFLLAKN